VSSPSPIVRLPLVAMAAVLAALTLAALLIAVDPAFRHWGWWRLGFFAIPVVVAVYYLNEYRKLPYEPWHFFPPQPSPAPAATPSPGAAPASAPPATPAPPAAVPAAPEEAADDEPFVDPVEEADRLDRERTGGAPGETDGSEPDAEAGPTTPAR
jgi:hypothetical protein